QEVVDYSGLEPDGLFLEGTGAMVLDHSDRVAYAVRSNRTDPVVLERFCAQFGYEPMVFDAEDRSGRSVYHTNVLMCIATEFVMICLDMITDAGRRDEIVRRFEDCGREVIALTHQQITDFAGNAIELQAPADRVLALSARAAASLTDDQRGVIGRSARLLALDVPTIEMAGGSVRCMLAGVHLARRD
ncbi:MAG: arginine deiminase-related protein, partial [Pseudomonadota bacterium]